MASSPAPRDGRDDGMSLVEVLIAAVILGILASSVLGIIVQTQSAHVDSRSRTAAASLAAREIDLIREEFGSSTTAPLDLADDGVVVNEHPLPGQAAGQPLRIDSQQYTVSRSTAWNVTGPGSSACEGGSLVDHPTLSVSVTVTWPNMGSTKPVVTHTQLAPPKGTGVSSTQAFAAVKVVDSDGAVNPGRTVRLSGAGGTMSALTDAAGCAVVALSPAAAGTAYTATLMDTGYVDVSGVANPSKSTGSVRPGQLNTAVTFAYDRAATLRVRVLDDAGNPYDAAGLPLTIVSTEAAGSSATRSVVATGAITEVQDLWPTRHGAYFGSAAPAAGYPTVDIAPGQTGQVDVVLTMATGAVAGLPPGADRVIAVPGTAACTDAAAREVPVGGFSIMPGTWSFYASGPAFDCSAGPASVSLVGGDNGDVVFGPTTLRATGVPAGGTLWAVHSSRAPGLSTCAAGTPYDALAVNVDAARTAPVDLAAGDWFVYRTDGPANGTCLSTPRSAYPRNIAHGAATTLAWTDQRPTVGFTVRNVPSSTALGRSYRIIVSTVPQTTCSTNTTTPGGATQLGAADSATVTGTLEQGTYYVYRQRTSGGSGNRCTSSPTNPVVLPGPAAAYSLDWSTGAVTAP